MLFNFVNFFALSLLEKCKCLCSGYICEICIFVFIGFYGHTIKKYNSFGDLVQVLGTPGKKGTGLNPLQFDNPAELHVDDTGDIYIVDGDGGLNNRLIKLSQGTWLSFVCCSKSMAQLVGSHLSDTAQSFGQRLCLHIAFCVCPVSSHLPFLLEGHWSLGPL